MVQLPTKGGPVKAADSLFFQFYTAEGGRGQRGAIVAPFFTDDQLGDRSSTERVVRLYLQIMAATNNIRASGRCRRLKS
ncbi:hypothetical protein KIN20_032479 [Parelaphostrongylus tenuis]|uniref:Uncharacterized protein n=1 Tax=Parelaphostrongylus tenuis TaxID=148309 RepID=A0AAD5R773_PARTN|nr:hypothetical protein KIN20_032479 [Parelaphostrongylus tenuis]